MENPMRWRGLVMLTLLITPLAPDPDVGVEKADDAKLRQLLDDMFGATFGRKRSILQAADKYQEAKRLAPNDTRVSYSWGLVCLKRLKHKDAKEQFEQAARYGASTYYPATRTLLWLGMRTTREREDTLKRVTKVANELAASKEVATREQRVMTAKWISELLDAARRANRSGKTTAVLETTTSNVRDVLVKGGYEAAWEAGRKAVELRHQQLTESAADRSKRISKKRQREAHEAIRKIQSKIGDIRSDKARDKLDASDARVALDETLERIEAELGRLEADYKFLEKQAVRATESINKTLRSITACRAGLMPTFGAGRNNQRTTLLGLQAELDREFAQYARFEEQAKGVINKARAIMAYRIQLVQQHDRDTGQRIQKHADFDRWTKRLDRKQKQMRDQLAAAGKKKTKRTRRPTFTGLAPFDLQRSREAVMATFRTGGEQ